MCGYDGPRPPRSALSPEESLEKDIQHFRGRLGRAVDKYTAKHPERAVEAERQLEELGQSLAAKRYVAAARVLRNMNLLVPSNESTKENGQLVREMQYMRDVIPVAKGDSAAEGQRLARRDPANGRNVALPASADEPEILSRRTRCTVDLALRLLPPADRQRYREEWAAELIDLPLRDQAPYALRLLSRSAWLRRELRAKPSMAPRVKVALIVMVPGADAIAAFAGLDWPAAALGGGWMLSLMWVLSSRERTCNLVSLIKALSRPEHARK